MAAYGITLASVAAPGATPISPNATAAQGFQANYAKLDVPNISDRDRLTIAILGLIYELNAAGGANYKTNHAGLIQDSVVFSGGISNLNQKTAEAANDWNAGVVADATLSTDVPTLLAEGRDLDNLSELQLERVLAFLRAQLRR